MDEENNQQLPTKRDEQREALSVYMASEVTLELYGYFDAGKKRRYPGKDGVPTKKTVTVPGGAAHTVPTAEYGYPNTIDQDLKRAFERIVAKRIEWRLKHDDNGDKVRRRHVPKIPITFSPYELLKEAGYTLGAANYRAAIHWAKRNTGTMIEAPFLIVPQDKVLSINTHLFRTTWTPGDELPTGNLAEKIYVIPEDWYLSHLAYNKTLLVDQESYKRLATNYLAKNLLAAIAIGFRRADPWRKSYRALCDTYSLRFYRKKSDRERKLAPDLWALHCERYLEGGPVPCTIEHNPPRPDPHGRGWHWDHAPEDSTLYFYAGGKFHDDQAAHARRVEQAKQITNGTNGNSPTAPAPETPTFEAVKTADLIDKFTTAAVQASHEPQNRGYYKSRIRALIEAGEAPLIEKTIRDARREGQHVGKVLYRALESLIDTKGLRDRIRKYATAYEQTEPTPEQQAQEQQHLAELRDQGTLDPRPAAGSTNTAESFAEIAARKALLRQQARDLMAQEQDSATPQATLNPTPLPEPPAGAASGV